MGGFFGGGGGGKGYVGLPSQIVEGGGRGALPMPMDIFKLAARKLAANQVLFFSYWLLFTD